MVFKRSQLARAYAQWSGLQHGSQLTQQVSSLALCHCNILSRLSDAMQQVMNIPHTVTTQNPDPVLDSGYKKEEETGVLNKLDLAAVTGWVQAVQVSHVSLEHQLPNVHHSSKQDPTLSNHMKKQVTMPYEPGPC